jgi:hypothetical protein
MARFYDPDPVLAQPIDELGGLCSASMQAAPTKATWTPRAPVRLYAARGDEQVPKSNSVECQAALRARGVVADVVDLGDIGHLESNIAAPSRVLAFFDAL